MMGHEEVEQALQITHEDRRVRGKGSFGGRGRGRQTFNKAEIECFKCHKFEHFQYEYPTWEKI